MDSNEPHFEHALDTVLRLRGVWAQRLSYRLPEYDIILRAVFV
jgi:hypothetical protein